MSLLGTALPVSGTGAPLLGTGIPLSGTDAVIHKEITVNFSPLWWTVEGL